ncbi:unnamed protein product [Euphydryas editha]|uniref:Uncharacterized protein n=1 Tax=Euphydryas editha TaxID=104508 RepID=A0AAU9TE16_EUPED|nr:unnamed protein product [Euphydryas editha]
MGPGRSNNFVNIAIITFSALVSAQDYYEEHHKNQIRSQDEHFTEIPKKIDFELEGENAVANFNKYVTNIQDLASKRNVHVTYKVQVITVIKNKHRKPNKLSNGKSKKYNIPLKKKNMKLSSFEMVLRKRVNDIGFKNNNKDEETTTDRQHIIFTTRSTSSGKYKPVVSGAKTKYAKIIRPVRNKIITLES